MIKKEDHVSNSGFQSWHVGVLGVLYYIQLSERTVMEEKSISNKIILDSSCCKIQDGFSVHRCLPSGEGTDFSQRNDFSLKIIRMSWNNLCKLSHWHREVAAQIHAREKKHKIAWREKHEVKLLDFIMKQAFIRLHHLPLQVWRKRGNQLVSTYIYLKHWNVCF